MATILKFKMAAEDVAEKNKWHLICMEISTLTLIKLANKIHFGTKSQLDYITYRAKLVKVDKAVRCL